MYHKRGGLEESLPLFICSHNYIDILTMVEQHNCFLKHNESRYPKKRVKTCSKEKKGIDLYYIMYYTLHRKEVKQMCRKEKLNHMISVRCSDTDLIKMSILKSNWEKEDPDIKYNNSDILRLCMRVSYDLENQINTLKKSLTNTS